MEKEFFEKYMNISEKEMLKGAIYGQCRIMDKEDIYNWVYQDELKLKKQQEINEKAIDFIKNGDLLYLANKNSVVYKNNIEIKAVADRLNDLLEILEDKEV